jgi:hypothetical protein
VGDSSGVGIETAVVATDHIHWLPVEAHLENGIWSDSRKRVNFAKGVEYTTD